MREHRYWRRYQRFSEWEDGIVRLAIEAGYVTSQIARMIGRSPDSVSRHCKTRGIIRGRGHRGRKVLAATLMLSATVSYAHEPAEPFSEWYNSLVEKGTNTVSCCGKDHDCEQIDEYKAGDVPGSYAVKYRGNWMSVPAERVLERADNPTGRAVICVHNNIPLCFVRPAEG